MDRGSWIFCNWYISRISSFTRHVELLIRQLAMVGSRSEEDAARSSLRNMHVFNPDGTMNKTEWRIAGKRGLWVGWGIHLKSHECIQPMIDFSMMSVGKSHLCKRRASSSVIYSFVGIYMALVFRKSSKQIRSGEPLQMTQPSTMRGAGASSSFPLLPASRNRFDCKVGARCWSRTSSAHVVMAS